MIAVDANFLLPFLSPLAHVPQDRSNHQKPVSHPHERIEGLIAEISEQKTKILIPTPVLSECLVRAGGAMSSYIDIIRKYTVFRIADFDSRAAIEVAILTHAALKAGDKRSGSNESWAKVKFDRQIVAIAKVHNAKAIYSDDPGVRRFAEISGLLVVGLADCPIPAGKRQATLQLVSNQTTE